MSALLRCLLIYSGAFVAGYVASAARIPLPWMIGPLVFSSALGLAGFAVRVPKVTRPIGQTIVSGAVGLSFTPAALVAVSEQIVAMIVAAVLIVAAGFLVAAVLMRLSRVDVITASLASVPVGPVEIANLALRHGVDPGPVVFAQTLRIMLLVLVVPPLIIALDGGVSDPGLALSTGEIDPAGAILLLALSAAGGVAFHLIRLSNPFFLGPLAFSAAASALMLPVSATPFVVLAAAQILLGVWLGSVFDRKLIDNARGFIPAACLSTVVMVALCGAIALGMSAVTGIRWTTAVLATAPGSVTEMALTAKILQEGVAMVTAFHIVRIFIIIPSAPLIFAITARLAGVKPGDR